MQGAGDGGTDGPGTAIRKQSPKLVMETRGAACPCPWRSTGFCLPGPHGTVSPASPSWPPWPTGAMPSSSPAASPLAPSLPLPLGPSSAVRPLLARLCLRAFALAVAWSTFPVFPQPALSHQAGPCTQLPPDLFSCVCSPRAPARTQAAGEQRPANLHRRYLHTHR